jgi:MoxR-like ATPase
MPFAPIPVTTEDFVTYLTENFGTEVNTKNLFQASEHFNCSLATVKKRLKQYKQGIGKWDLTIQEKLEITYNAPSASPAIVENLIPDKDPNFVPFGNFSDVKRIIQSGIFYPTFITGLSGNGKTLGIEQACALLKKELIRVNITIETDEDDLIGGFRLVNGETVWHNGPVIEALERGAILLLDEVDLASNKILCLQSVLEGKGLFLKKTGRYVERRSGFNIFATANTKGKGSEDGRFIGTNVLNEAFLERFALTFEQDYPTVATETKILEKAASSLAVLDKEFCSHLANWADIIRRTFNDGGVDEVISTRRLVHIIRAFAIWQNRMKAIKVCTNRFDDETKQSFLELYDKIDADVVPNEVENEATV